MSDEAGGLAEEKARHVALGPVDSDPKLEGVTLAETLPPFERQDPHAPP